MNIEYIDTQGVEYICGLLSINPPFIYLRLICFKTRWWNWL